jgi:3-deoxy-manno-octulosonate cytidylyltransferase (CMP-KDO synthetase)
MNDPVLAVIPARFAAQRFPGKPLAVLWGKPMLQHVWERARAARGIDRLIVATDDERIAAAARGWGAEVAMTSPECASGTDRVAEVARAHPEFEIVLNIQGDEPELETEALSRLAETMRADESIRMGTIAHREVDAAALQSEHVVKVFVDGRGFAVRFTRQPLSELAGSGAALRHAGVYAFRRDLLLEFSAWPQGTLEKAERLEQLRAVERGVSIKVVVGERSFSGVDTPEQMAALEARGEMKTP